MIITLNKDHIKNLVFIENSCFTHPMSETNLFESITNDKYLFLGYLVENKLVGYGSVFIVADEAYINNIAVLKEYRNQGIAKKIINELIKISNNKNCSFITLEVRESNIPAISLYENHGFKQICIRNNYYDEPIENAIIMTKILEKKK